VNESVCIGCRLCAQQAPNTFMMDEETGKARVYNHWADDDEDIEIARELFPVDCIHCVPIKMLPVLEHVMEFCVKNEVPDRDPSRLHQGLQNPFIRAEVFNKQFAEARVKRTAAAKKSLGDANTADLEVMFKAAQAIKRMMAEEPTVKPTVEEVNNVTIDMPWTRLSETSDKTTCTEEYRRAPQLVQHVDTKASSKRIRV